MPRSTILDTQDTGMIKFGRIHKFLIPKSVIHELVKRSPNLASFKCILVFTSGTYFAVLQTKQPKFLPMIQAGLKLIPA